MTDLAAWYPIIHSRTAIIDFRERLLVRPSWFTRQDINEARTFILSSTRDANSLVSKANGVVQQRPRWSQFGGQRFRAFGVTADAAFFSDRFTHELDAPREGASRKRPLYAFVGFAARSHEMTGFTPPRDTNLMSGLYEKLIAPRFFEEPLGSEWSEATLVGEGCELSTSEKNILDQVPKGYNAIGDLDHGFDFWPNTCEQKNLLWNQVSLFGWLNLLLDGPRVEFIRDTPFDIVTSSTIDEAKWIKRKLKMRSNLESSPSTKRSNPQVDVIKDMRPETDGAALSRLRAEQAEKKSTIGTLPIVLSMCGAAALLILALNLKK